MEFRWPRCVLESLILGLLVLFTACGGHRSAIGDGALQKRQHRSGWHWDPGFRASKKPVEPIRQMDDDPDVLPARAWVPTEPLMASVRHAEPMTTPPLRLFGSGTEDPSSVAFAREMGPFPTMSRPTPIPGLRIDLEDRAWNPWSIPAFVVGLGTVAYAILGTSALLAVIGVIATLLLATIAVRKGRMNEWKGKGFAVSALIIGTLSALITLIALIAGGT